jgi:hypothetical protein
MAGLSTIFTEDIPDFPGLRREKIKVHLILQIFQDHLLINPHLLVTHNHVSTSFDDTARKQ